MRQRIVFLICVVILGVTYPLLAGGQEPYREIQGAKKSTLDFHGWLKTYFIYKNDQDFDSKTPIFNEYGQSLGFFAVAFDPRITWQPHPQITVSYLADITGSLWSSTNVDPRLDQLQNQPVYLQKEFWTQVILPSNTYGFRVGFQYFEDPTRLFVKKYLGALRTFYRRDSSWLAFTVAQIPDTTYEGIDFSENNFENDNFVFALDGRISTERRLAFRPGLFFQWDRTVVDKTKFLVNPCLNLHGQLSEDLTFDIDLVLQTGRWEASSIGNQDMGILAGAMQAHGRLGIGKGYLEGNVLFFSPEDGDLYNGRDTAFEYSGYANSRTLLLTENDLFDQYDNLDERAAASKAGLFLADLTGGLNIAHSVELFTVLGYGMVLEKKFANGGQTLGLEYDLGVGWQIYDQFLVTLVGGVLVPGHAGSALYNELGNLRATDPMYYFQGMVRATF